MTFHSTHYYAGIKLPETRKASIELWKFIKQNELEELLKYFEIEQEHEQEKTIRRHSSSSTSANHLVKSSLDKEYAQTKTAYVHFSQSLAKKFNLNRADKRDLIVIDKYYYLVKFCLSNSLGLEQISALVSVLTRTHNLACDTSFGNLDETFDYFKQLLFLYATHRPPFSICLFTPKQIELIVEYFLDSYFKQFKLFKYVFTPEVVFDIKLKYNGLEEEKKQCDDQLLETTRSNEFMKAAGEMLESQMAMREDENEDEESAEMSELRQFVKNYLNKRVDHVREELLSDELMLQHQNQQTQKAGNKLNKQDTKTSKKQEQRSEAVKTPNKKK
jgi:hypothetical protein